MLLFFAEDGNFDDTLYPTKIDRFTVFAYDLITFINFESKIDIDEIRIYTQSISILKMEFLF